MLKQDLISAYEQIVEINKFTYKEICNLSGLSQSQFASILKHKAKGVSIEKMEK